MMMVLVNVGVWGGVWNGLEASPYVMCNVGVL